MIRMPTVGRPSTWLSDWVSLVIFDIRPSSDELPVDMTAVVAEPAVTTESRPPPSRAAGYSPSSSSLR